MNKYDQDNSEQKENLLETGKFYLINNRYEEALKVFEKLLEENKNDPEIYYHIGLVKEASNEVDDAKKMFLETLKLSPNHKLAKKHLNKLLGINDKKNG